LPRYAGSGRKGNSKEGRRKSSIARRARRSVAISRSGDGRDSFRTALATTREQGHAGYESHAATSLARLWGEQCRRGEAHNLPTPVYGSFTKSFGTPNLKEAKRLPDQLA
jgi:predicted ATPase